MSMSSRGILRRAAALLAALPLTSIAFAHHSFAMFDATQTLTTHATVRDFQWGNPHTWLDLVVVDKSGAQKPLSLELNGVSGLRRSGWKPGTLKPGDEVTLIYHPMRNGTPAGQLVSIVVPGGHSLKGQ